MKTLTRLGVVVTLVAVDVIQDNSAAAALLIGAALAIAWMVERCLPRIQAEQERASAARIARLADAYRAEQDRAAYELYRLRMARRALITRPWAVAA